MARAGIITKWVLVFGVFVVTTSWAETPADDVSNPKEEAALAKLRRVQQGPQFKIAPFVTDGCSGGLSEGWAILAKRVPAFHDRFGERPPYESCCVEHDRAYWQGQVANGYAARLQADQDLRRCVVDYGQTHRAKYARDFAVTVETIDQSFKTIADAMYYAVRLGGGPCTPFSWRWGYGWPRCDANDWGVPE